MEKDVYQQLTETLNNGIIQTNEDIDDEGQHTGESIDNLQDELQSQALTEPEEIDRPKIIRKNGQIVDEDGKTYEDYLKEMGVDVDMPEGHYVNNAELYKHMVAYCEARDKALAEGKPKPPVDNFIGEAIMKIATHLSFRPNFIGYSYRMDMIGDAIDNCLTYIDSFDPKKSKNPFSYLTQVCWCAFIRRLKIEKKNNIIKGRYMMMSNITDTMQLDCDEDGNPVVNNQGMVHRYVEMAAEDEAKTQRQKARKQAEREERKKASSSVKVKRTVLEDYFE